MESNKQEVIYCADGDESKTYCNICDKLCIDRYSKNHLKPSTHINYNFKETTIK